MFHNQLEKHICLYVLTLKSILLEFDICFGILGKGVYTFRNQQELRELTVLQVNTNSLELRVVCCSEHFIFLNSEIIKWYSR